MKKDQQRSQTGTVLNAGAVNATTDVANERAHFRALIVGNPDYFGNLPDSPFKPIVQLQGNTTYELLKCVGFHPQANRLDAVVFVNQSLPRACRRAAMSST